MKEQLLVILMTTALCCIGTPSQAAPEQSLSTLDCSTLPTNSFPTRDVGMPSQRVASR